MSICGAGMSGCGGTGAELLTPCAGGAGAALGVDPCRCVLDAAALAAA